MKQNLYMNISEWFRRKRNIATRRERERERERGSVCNYNSGNHISIISIDNVSQNSHIHEILDRWIVYEV